MLPHVPDLRFLLLLVPPLILLAGLAVLTALGWTRHRGRGLESPARRAVRTMAVVSVVIGLYLTVGVVSGFFFFIAWIILTIILVMAVVRFWRQETRRLVTVLAVASERGISIESAARAFAEDSSAWMANGATKLADYLEAGIPLSMALQRAWLSAPPELLLAADMGERTGTLGPSLRQALNQMCDLETVLRSVWDKLFYIGAIGISGLLIMTFLMVKIIPVFSQMFEEFGIEIPMGTRVLISMSHLVLNYWYVLLLVVLAAIGVLLVGLVAFVGIPIRSLPIVRRIYGSIDIATMMRTLSVAVQHKLPLTETLYLLAGFYPLSGVRSRLAQAAGRVAQGMPWPDALQRARLIRGSENGVFKAAERAGNLAWMLNEMADSRVRQASRRFRTIAGILLPLLVAGAGFCVATICVGMMLPLFKLIKVLA